MTPANDNNPRQAGDMSLAERRAWLATLPANAKPVLAWPTAERLSRLDSPTAAQALYRYAELTLPPHMVPANDNREPGVEAPVVEAEMTIETRPSVDETLRAACDGLRARVVVERPSGKIIERHAPRLGFEEGDFRLGNLTFRAGALVSFGVTKRGVPLRPREAARRARGRSPSARSESSIRALVKTAAPIARGSGWLGGIRRARGNTSRPDIGDAQAEVEMHRNARRDAVRLALGPVNARVLDLAVTDASAREIGEAFGHVGKVAERRAIRMINAAVEELQQIAA